MYCTVCGSKLPEDNNYCGNCGRVRELNAGQTRSSNKALIVAFAVIAGLILVTLLAVYVTNSLDRARQEGLDSVIQLDMGELGEFADNFVSNCIDSGGSYNESTATCVR